MPESKVKALAKMSSMNDNTAGTSGSRSVDCRDKVGRLGHTIIPLGNGDLSLVAAKFDQDGYTWVNLRFGRRHLPIRISDYMENESAILRKLSAIGANLLTTALQRAFRDMLQNVRPHGKIFVAYQPGFVFLNRHKDHRPSAYVLGSGKVIQRASDRKLPIIVAFSPNVKVASRGKKEDFERGIGPLARDQAIPMLMLGIALAPLLMPFVPPSVYVENSIIEVCGMTTDSKTSVAKSVAAACWGGSPTSKNGYLDSWNATVNQVENQLPLFNHCFKGLDEATAVSGSVRQRAESLSNIVHRISQGETKGRMGAIATRQFQLLAVSTSNQPLSSIMNEVPNVADGVLVRILTILVPDRITGVFDHFPKGFSTLDELRIAMHDISNSHYGHIAPGMAKAILNASNKDLEGLRSSLEKLMQTFMKAAGVAKGDDIDVRRIKPIALAFAAGVLAKRWGVVDGTIWGSFKQPLLRAWRMAQSPSVPNKVQVGNRLFDYLRKYAEAVVTVPTGNRRKMSDRAFQSTRAFVGKRRDGQWYAAFPPKRMKTRFPGFETDLRILRTAGKLISDAGSLQTKMRVRRSITGREPLDRVYSVLLDSWPLEEG